MFGMGMVLDSAFSVIADALEKNQWAARSKKQLGVR